MEEKEDKINALLEDNRFVDWVVNPESVYGQYWERWIAGSTENAMLAEEARGFILHVRKSAKESADLIGQERVDHAWEHIEGMISRHEAALPEKPEPVTGANRRGGGLAGFMRTGNIRIGSGTGLNFRKSLAIAASVAGALLLVGILWPRHRAGQRIMASKSAQPVPSAELIRYNDGDRNELVFLPDGSRVTLAKGARISYDRIMNGSRRAVSLTGEAFFDVAKSQDKPFFIYTGKMIVKVLGTSFRVITSATKEAVVVKTGKVSVCLRGQEPEAPEAKMVLPNQSCTYSFPKKSLITATYAEPAGIELKTEAKKSYEFEDAPVDSVFKVLEKMYDLPVLYNARTFEDCYINITLGTERLEDKLEVITQTINASYKMSGKGIVIEGKGCK